MPKPRLIQRASQLLSRKKRASASLQSTQDTQHPRSASEPLPHVAHSGPPDPLDDVQVPPDPQFPDEANGHQEGNGGISFIFAASPSSSAPDKNHPEAAVQSPLHSRDAISEKLAAAEAVFHNERAQVAPPNPVSSIDIVSESIGEGVQVAQYVGVNLDTVVSVVNSIPELAAGVKAIEENVASFMEGSAVLMKALDAVKGIHPAVDIAITAFKAVWMLEMNRRENDKKVIALYVEMKDMMSVLLRLQNIEKDVADQKSPDGTSITGRLERLVKGTADDIIACGNACDTYSKKRLLTRVLMSPVWNTRLSNFAGVFTKRSSEFEFALTVHMALGVNTTNMLLNEMLVITRRTDARIEMMMKVFERSASSEELELKKFIDEQGGKEACQQSPELLQEVAELEQHKLAARDPNGDQFGVNGGVRQINVEEIREDLALDPTVAMEKNKTVFSRKLDMQKRQIEELSKTVHRTGDRIIEELTKALQGPYDKIIDRDVYELWKLMGWRGSVKCRHFVMALRDYFQEKWESQDRHTDQWALAHINVLRIQPISEAFDDDASGFVTLAEVNSFTSSRPPNWSLPHWIAYWAVGWHQTVADYSRKISELFDKIFTITINVLPENQTAAGKYLGDIYKKVWHLRKAIHRPRTNTMLQERFQEYVKDEEDRLRMNLETVRYNVDAMATLVLITGKGRIEKFALPLLYLILQRHFEILRIACKVAIHPDELWDASKTIGFVLQAVRERKELLTALFGQQRLDVDEQFLTFAHGLFSVEVPGPEQGNEKYAVDYAYNEELEDQSINPEDILNYPLNPELRDFAAYDHEPEEQQHVQPAISSNSPLKMVLGRWNGYLYMEDSETPTLPISGMMSMSFQPCTPDGHDLRFAASDRNAVGEFSMEGKCNWGASNDTVKITLQLTFAPQAGLAVQYWTGELDTFTETITGESSLGLHPSRKTRPMHFVFKRIAPEYMCFQPAPAIFKASKISALWSFALSAVLQQVRRDLLSWSFFRNRRDNRKVFLEYEIRAAAFGRPLDSDEKRKFRQARQLLNPADGRFLRSISRYLIRRSTDHRLTCGVCNGAIGGARIVCFSCITVLGRISGTLNTCESPQCVEAFYHVDYSPNRPSHNLLKLRRFVLDVRQASDLKRVARSAISRLVRSSNVTTAAVDFHSDDADNLDSNSSLDIEAYDMKHSRSNRENGEKADPLAVLEPMCAVCAQLVQRPYWYCIQCDDLTFICNECDTKGPRTVAEHKVTHDLLRSKMPEGEQDRIYGRDSLPLPPRVRTPTQVPVIPGRRSPDEPSRGKHVTIVMGHSSSSDKPPSKIYVKNPRRRSRSRSLGRFDRGPPIIMPPLARTGGIVIIPNNSADGRQPPRTFHTSRSNSRSPPDSPRGRPTTIQLEPPKSRSRSPIVDNDTQIPAVIVVPDESHEKPPSVSSSLGYPPSLRRGFVAHSPTRGIGVVSTHTAHRITTVTMPSSAAAIILGDPANHPLTSLGNRVTPTLSGDRSTLVISSLENRMSRVEHLLETVLERLGAPMDSKK